MSRFATIDVGSNTVLLLVAERQGESFAPLVERAEITRLGRGVDATRHLDPQAIRGTVEVVARYAAEARALGAREIACVATSAARDAENGAAFFEAARAAAGIVPEVISGEEEARLVWASAWRDFGERAGSLAVLDVGGGSTEVVVGSAPAPRARRSLQVGAVRLTERARPPDPPGAAALAELRARASEALSPARDLLVGARPAALVGVAGTVTTLAAVERGLPVYDAGVVHGAEMTRSALEALLTRLATLTTAERARLPGMEPKRADVIVAGGSIVLESMALFGFERLIVSDRGVRWGLLHERFGASGE